VLLEDRNVLVEFALPSRTLEDFNYSIHTLA
jgi:hypothetical protein